MSVNSKTTLKIALHVAFCVAMIILFGSFCKLRTVAAGHIYKEYLSGVIAIGMMYFNAFVLFPVFFKTNRVADRDGLGYCGLPYRNGYGVKGFDFCFADYRCRQ